MDSVDRLRLDTRAQAILAPGEELLWTGRPDPRQHFTKFDILIEPVALFFVGYVGYLLLRALRDPDPQAFDVWANAVGLAVGLFIAFGRFGVKARRKRRLQYVLTDRRAVILRGRDGVESRRLSRSPVALDLFQDHLNVTFGPSPSLPFAVWENSGADVFIGSQSFAFHDVSDADALLAALDRIAQERIARGGRLGKARTPARPP